MKAFILIVMINGNSSTPAKIDTYPDKPSCEEAGQIFKSSLKSTSWWSGYYVCVPAGK